MTHNMELQLYKKLKELREKNNLAQDDVAQELNISRQTVSNWETGKSLPDLNTTICLCKFYDISINELLDIDSSKNTLDADTTSVEDITPATENNSYSFVLNEKQLALLETIGLAVVLILACQFSIIGTIIPIAIIIWSYKTKRNYKIIYFLCLICLLSNIYNTYSLISYFSMI